MFYLLSHYKITNPLRRFAQTDNVHTQVWETAEADASQLHVCDATNGEDPACSDSVPLTEYSPADHMTYTGVYNSPCG